VSGIDTWDKLIALPNSEYKFLVHINPGMHLICGSDWTSVGSNTYSYDTSEVSLNAVTDDATEMTERTTVALVQANAGSWYFDFFTQKLYVRAFDDDDLSNSNTTTVIIMYVWKHYATDNGVYDGFKHKALVRQNSLPSMDLSVDDIVDGIYKFNFGSFTMNNDGWFEAASDDYLWLNRKVLVYIGGEDLDFSEYALYFVGRISDMKIGDADVIFSVKDIRVGTFSNIPVEKYWKADLPDLNDSDEGKPIPIFYGEKEEIVPVVTELFDDTNFKAQLRDFPSAYTDYTTEALSVTENDVPLLPASPATSDSFYIGHTTTKFGAVEIDFYQGGVGSFLVEWFYAFAPGNNWRRLKWLGLSDGTDGFICDPGWQKVTFRIPHKDWELRDVNGITAYWVEARVTAFGSMSQQPVANRIRLGNTKGVVGKICGHIMEEFVSIKKNDAVIAPANYSEDLANGEFTLTGEYFDADNDVLSVHAKGKTVAAAYITKGGDICKDILKSYLNFLDADLDLTSFTDTNAVRTYALSIYLDTEKSSREVLQTLGRSTVAFLSPTEDGKLSFVAYEPTLEPGTLELHDADYYPDWKVTKNHKFVKKRVELKYDRNPKTQEWKQVEATNPDVDKKYGINEVLTLESYVKYEADATTVVGGIKDMCSKPITEVSTSFGMKGFKLFPTRKVVMNRERAADATGSFVAKVFRIKNVVKDSSTETTRIVGMDDLQTLGAAFCYVCFSCQSCVSAQESCTDCYSCQICVATQAGCAVCDDCQVCVATMLGCVLCDTVEVCPTCESTESTCSSCENCYITCQDCYACETTVNYCTSCQQCYGCDDCDTCQSFITCASCDGCQNCFASCQVCDTAEDCPVCDVCDSCESGVTCGSCDDNCQSCVGCQLCDVNYNTCTGCQECVTCDNWVNCNQCDDCQTCVNCMQCATSESCGGCDVCDYCQICVSCDGSCEICETCVSSG